jgi:repressor LexA
MMVRKKKGLGERHTKILEFLRDYSDENSYPPTIREIGENTGISSTSVVNYYLDQLEEMGKIERDRKISRGVRLTERLTEKVEDVVQVISDLVRIPIMGPIAAGLPLPVFEAGISFETESEAHAVDIARSTLPTRDIDRLFALEVQGDSMIDAMINDGDIVVMKPAIEARNGEMVAVWLPETNETTLKYFFKEKDGYRLQPANPTMQPILIDKNQPLEIKGKVVMVIRKFESLAA